MKTNELTDLSDEELRVRVAEALGAKWYRYLNQPQGSAPYPYIVLALKKKRQEWGEVEKPAKIHPSMFGLEPHYPRDLNAMHSAEETLSAAEKYRYGEALGNIVRADFQSTQNIHAWHASARQRCIAFLMTKNPSA